MEIRVFIDKFGFLGSLREYLSIYNKVKPLVEKSPLDNPINVKLNTAGFILRKRSKVIGRGNGLSISCCGYLDLPDSAARILRVTNNQDLYDLFVKAGTWNKGEARVSSVFWKDSLVSGFVARRAVLNNNYRYSEIIQAGLDAEWRAQNKASANPNLINGSDEDFEELNSKGQRQCVNF